MRRFPALIVAAVSAAALLGPPAATASPSTPDRLATSPATLTLVTGQHVTVSPDGRQVRVAAAQGAPATPLTTLRGGSHTCVIPATAAPYLGRQLDPALFDVAGLGAAPTTGRLPVRIGYQGSGPPTVPGVTVTSASGGLALGYLTAASASDFGAALARQYAADAAAGWPEHSTLFGAVLTIRPDIGSRPVVHPQFPMVTLIVKVVDAGGRPAKFGFLGIMNVDDARRYIGFVPVYRGEARVSVPRGNYSAMTQVTDVSGRRLTLRVVTRNTYLVSADQQTLTLDARSATHAPTATTPRPASVDTLTFDWVRTDRTGHGSFDAGVMLDGGARLLLTPAPAARVGTTVSATVWQLHGAAPAGRPYTYDLAFPAVGVPADQSHRVRPGDLGTVAARYYSEAGPASGATGRLVNLPGRPFAFGSLLPLRLPTVRTEYVSAIPGAVWYQSLLPNVGSIDNPFAGALDDGGRLVRAGSVRAAEWNRDPLVPRVPVRTSGDSFWSCYACRTAHSMLLVLAPFTDSTPGHTGELYTEPSGPHVTRVRLFRDGALVTDEPDVAGVLVPAPAAAGAYRLVYDVDRRSNGAQLSTTTHTEVTFRSGAGDGPAAPPGWACFAPGTCHVLPLLQAYLELPLTLSNLLPSGRSTATLLVGHIPAATRPAISAAALRLRVQGGTWRTVPLTRLADGQYRAALDLAAGTVGKSVDVELMARDALGGTLTQSTTRATIVAR